MSAATALHTAPWRTQATTRALSPFFIDDQGRLRMRPHPGQERALRSTARFILLLAGLQSGKTLTGPWWMLREMALCGPGDYLGAGPTFPLLQMKCLPEYEALFGRRLGWGKLYKGYPPVLELNEKGRRNVFAAQLARSELRFQDTETRIIFGAGIKPESLESATVKAAHLDEAGQKQFLRASHEAVLGRLSIYRGRILYTTTPYQLGWLKAEVYDRAAEERTLPPEERTYELVQFASTMNPAFPAAEFEEMRDKLPGWKFNMRYRGRFERPAGMIYDCFRRDVHVTPREPIPKEWSRYLGLDFGGVNTAAVKLACEPGTRRYVLYAEYHAGGKTSKEHATDLQRGEPRFRRAVGGSKSEGQWRREFKEGGLVVREPEVSDVEVGIDRVYEMLKNHPEMHRVEGFEDATHDPSRPHLEVMEGCAGVLDEIESYSRVLDDQGEPTEKIEDKSIYHRLDGLRYIGTYINAKSSMTWGKA